MLSFRSLILFCCIILILTSCKDSTSRLPEGKNIIDDSSEMNSAISADIEIRLRFAEQNKGEIEDTLSLSCLQPVVAFYKSNDFVPVWSDSMKWKPLSDSLLNYIGKGLEEGLFPADYKYKTLFSLHSLLKDSLKRKDAALWSVAELLYTDAFMLIARDLSQGRLQPDSLSWHHNEQKIKEFFVPMFTMLTTTTKFRQTIDSLQPIFQPYIELKGKLRAFIDSMDRTEYTYLNYPYKQNDEKDSIQFLIKLRKRLVESGAKDSFSILPDSLGMASLVKQYQIKRNLNSDGKIGVDLIDRLNNTDLEKYKRLAITLDRYKELPRNMPEKYIWVNLPQYFLSMWDKDSLVMSSKIICGKPTTQTPTLSSAISEIVLLPTWTVPESIIKKEMLPGLKRNSNYLSKKGLYLLDSKGQRVRADSINWKKYSKGIPYRVQQGSGDDNALGVIKFNFSNPYAVYLHDTNQRYLFKNSKRALSHGCVRVQEWHELAKQILRYDSLLRKSTDTLLFRPDSVSSFISRLKAKNARKSVALKNNFPLYICYYSCISENGKLRILEDVYKLDKQLRNKYFASKMILPFL